MKLTDPPIDSSSGNVKLVKALLVSPRDPLTAANFGMYIDLQLLAVRLNVHRREGKVRLRPGLFCSTIIEAVKFSRRSSMSCKDGLLATYTTSAVLN